MIDQTTRTTETRVHDSEGRLPRPLRLFSVLTFVITSLCVLIEAALAHAGRRYPYDWPLLPNGDPFRDFYLYQPRYDLYHSRSFFTFVGPPNLYPAPATVIYKLFYLLPHSTVVFLTGLVVAVLVSSVLVEKALVARGLSRGATIAFLFVCVVCSYPFWFEFEQANIEYVLWGIIALGLWALLRGNNRSAAILIGLAGAIKLYPLVLLGLFLSRKQYRECITGVVTAGIATVISLWLACPDIITSLRYTRRGLNEFRATYALGFSWSGFDHSLFGLIKTLLIPRVRFSSTDWLIPARAQLSLPLAVFVPLSALAGIALYFTVIRRLPIVNQVICLTVACIWLPPVSYDYTLIHLYAPWVLLVLCAMEYRHSVPPGLTMAFVCFAVLLAPETELIYRDQTVAGQVKAFALLVLMFVALRYPFPSSFDRRLLLRSGAECNES